MIIVKINNNRSIHVILRVYKSRTCVSILNAYRVVGFPIEGDERAPQAQDDTLVTGDDNLPPPPPDAGAEPRVVVATERMES
ncbi:unnamed protein product [Rotaria sp. Silwood2]|nr:unnamed protein product [Rotaria sp. Silwood2]